MKKKMFTILFALVVLPSLFFPQTILLHITRDTTWSSSFTLPTANTTEVSVYIENAVLTIEHGVAISANTYDKIIVGENGKIIANGTKDDPIIFTTNSINREAESWEGIVFAEHSGRINDKSLLNFVNFYYGGASSKQGVVALANSVEGDVEFNNCIFYKNSIGITAPFGGSIKITNCKFTANVGGGIVLEDAKKAVIRDCYFYGNDFAFRAQNNFPDTLADNLFADENQRAFLPELIHSGIVNISSPGYIEYSGEVMPFTLGFNDDSPNLFVEESGLSIAPGVIIKAHDLGDVKPSLIIDESSHLTTDGTKEKPILFTTEKKDKTWGGVESRGFVLEVNHTFFENSDSAALVIKNDGIIVVNESSFKNNLIGILADSNSYAGGNFRGNIYYCTFNNNQTGIIASQNASINVGFCDIADNFNGVFLEPYSKAVFVNSKIRGNSNAGIYSDDANLDINNLSIEENPVGIYFETNDNYNSRLGINNSRIRYNSSGIITDLGFESNVELYGCNLAGNENYAINNLSDFVIDAKNCWWGDKSGPYDNSNNSSDPTGLYNPTGLGSEVSDFVDYSDWLIYYISDIPNIMNVTDVPNDQGRHVFVVWSTSEYDQKDSEISIVKYSVWRKMPFDENNSKSNSVKKSSTIEKSLLKEMNEEYWEFIGDVTPLPELGEYFYTAPTLADSNANGIFYSTYMVVAHTEDPKIYYKSEPRSGYSIDNIEPGVPSGLSATANSISVTLVWKRNMEEDFAYYSIYKDGELLTTTVDTSFIDSEVLDGNYEYKITASDINGNESEPAFIDATVGVDDDVLPTKYSLEQNYPNPFNPSTTIKYSIPNVADAKFASVTNVSLNVYDMLGREVATLVNKSQKPGNYEVLFNAANLASGTYFYRIISNDFVSVKKFILMK